MLRTILSHLAIMAATKDALRIALSMLIYGLTALPAFGETLAILRLDISKRMDYEERAAFVGFVTAHVGKIVNIKAAIPQAAHLVKPNPILELGWDGPMPSGRYNNGFCTIPVMDHGDRPWAFLVRLRSGFTGPTIHMRASGDDQCGKIQYAAYDIDGFFEVRAAAATELGTNVFELVPVGQLDNTIVKTVTTWPIK